MVLTSNKEEGFGWVEGHTLHLAPVLLKGVLRVVLRQLMNEYSLTVQTMDSEITIHKDIVKVMLLY
jgi:hypothetical protein